MDLNGFKSIKLVFEEALKKYGKEGLAEKLSCSESSIYSVNLGRQGLPRKKIEMLCKLMDKTDVWEQYCKEFEAPRNEAKREYSRSASDKMAFLSKFDKLTPEHQNVIIHRILECENEERYEEMEEKAQAYLYAVDAKDVDVRMDDPLYDTSQLFYDAEQRFGCWWLLNRFGIRRRDYRQKELEPATRKIIIRFICAYDKCKALFQDKEKSLPANALMSFEQVRDYLSSGVVIPRNKGEWGGADVIIVSNPAKCSDNGYTYVVTKYARELTWLFYQLKNISYASKWMDRCNKFEFFGRLARAANTRIKAGGNDETAHDLCLAVLDEAEKIKNEIETEHLRHVF